MSQPSSLCLRQLKCSASPCNAARCSAHVIMRSAVGSTVASGGMSAKNKTMQLFACNGCERREHCNGILRVMGVGLSAREKRERMGGGARLRARTQRIKQFERVAVVVVCKVEDAVFRRQRSQCSQTGIALLHSAWTCPQLCLLPKLPTRALAPCNAVQRNACSQWCNEVWSKNTEGGIRSVCYAPHRWRWWCYGAHSSPRYSYTTIRTTQSSHDARAVTEHLQPIRGFTTLQMSRCIYFGVRCTTLVYGTPQLFK